MLPQSRLSRSTSAKSDAGRPSFRCLLIHLSSVQSLSNVTFWANIHIWESYVNLNNAVALSAAKSDSTSSVNTPREPCIIPVRCLISCTRESHIATKKIETDVKPRVFINYRTSRILSLMLPRIVVVSGSLRRRMVASVSNDGEE